MRYRSVCPSSNLSQCLNSFHHFAIICWLWILPVALTFSKILLWLCQTMRNAVTKDFKECFKTRPQYYSLRWCLEMLKAVYNRDCQAYWTLNIHKYELFVPFEVPITVTFKLNAALYIDQTKCQLKLPCELINNKLLLGEFFEIKKFWKFEPQHIHVSECCTGNLLTSPDLSYVSAGLYYFCILFIYLFIFCFYYWCDILTILPTK